MGRKEKLPVTVVAATNYTRGNEMELPWRYVVLQWDKGSSAHEFSRHMQVKDVKNEWDDQIFYHGHYYCHYEDAEMDMVKSMESNNRNYGPTNVSHIPELDFIREHVRE